MKSESAMQNEARDESRREEARDEARTERRPEALNESREARGPEVGAESREETRAEVAAENGWLGDEEADAPREPEAPAAPAPPAEAPAADDGGVQTTWIGGAPETREKLEEVFRSIYDPEIPVNVYDLGLIYQVTVDDSGYCEIQMTLTAPGCPVAGPIVQEVEAKALMVPGISIAKADLVWEPPWSMDRMSETARLQLGFY